MATDARHLRLFDCRLPIGLLAGLTRLELAISASTVQRFDPTKLQPPRTFTIADCQLPSHCRLPIGDFRLACVVRGIDSPRQIGNRQLKIGNVLVDLACLTPGDFGARGEIRTHHKADLKSAASSNWATRAMNCLNWYSWRDSNHQSLPIANCRFPIGLFSETSGTGNQIGNRQSKIGNAFARVMQSGRHRKLKPSVLEVRILSRVPIQINVARVAQLEEAADLRPAL